MKYIKNDQNQTLNKNVAAVHICNVPLMQRKLHNVLMFIAVRSKPLRNPADEYQIPLATLMELVGYNSNNLTYLKEGLSSLARNTVEWNLFDDKQREVEWGTASLLASARIRGNICFFSFPPPLERMLRTPELYAKIDLRIQRRFSSKYALALYENVIRYINLGHTRWIELDLLRKILGIDEDSKEIEFKYLNRLLKKAVESVNEEAGLVVEIEYRREKRCVDAVRFSVKHDPAVNLSTSDLNLLERAGVTLSEEMVSSPLDPGISSSDSMGRSSGGQALEPAAAGEDELIAHLCSYLGFTRPEAEELVAEYETGLIREHLDEVEKKYRENKIRWVRPYLVSVLKGASTGGRGLIEDERRLQEQEKLNLRKKVAAVQEKEQQQKKLDNEYLLYRTKILQSLMQELSLETIKKLNNDFIDSIRGTLHYDIYRRRGFEGPVIQSLYETFITEQLLVDHPELSQDYFLTAVLGQQ